MSDDTAGPLLGWSLGTGLNRRTIDELQSFPCVFSFKAVGVAGEDFVSSLLSRVARVLGRAVTAAEHRVRTSEHGRYTSVTLELPVTSGDQVYSIYEAIHEDARVRYLL
jgi:putative lipoic acid-binding regulatory protein